jgi:hypothetical protein
VAEQEYPFCGDVRQWVGHAVITLHPIEGIQFVEETVTALGYSTELASHLFQTA